MQREIIEQYPEDFPFPSCLILGKNEQGKILHVCMSDEGSASRIITAYYPVLTNGKMILRRERGHKYELFSL